MFDENFLQELFEGIIGVLEALLKLIPILF